MFDENINLIRGYSSCGKTEFLMDLANNLVDAGFKICFISTTDEKRYSRNKFTFYRSLSSRFEEDYKMIQLVSEIIIRDGYDYLFIDDIDNLFNDHFFSINETDKFLEKLINTPVKKILTCEYEESSYLPILSKTSANFFSGSKIESETSYSEYYIAIKGVEKGFHIKKGYYGDYEKTTEVIKKTIRDIKIENILND
jgi:hypothetical protein